ncbi:MAG: M64 family metallopeptidase [Bacteroidales bacterium]
MHRLTLIFLLYLFFLPNKGFAQFDAFFENKTLRLDYYHGGNAQNEYYAFDAWIEEPYWAGSHTSLIDTFQYGQYSFEVNDRETGKTLYSRGYTTLFSEWQTTNEAHEIDRVFSESVVMPFPKKPVIINLFSRNRSGLFEKKFSLPFDPADPYIIQQSLPYPFFDVHTPANPANALDIVLIPEGYTASEMDQFRKDCHKFAEELFAYEPYNQFRDKINIRGIEAPSAESGTDIPVKGIWKNTLLDSRMYTFGVERYLMTSNFKAVRNVAACAPYDQIYILVNTPEYGGGAIFNHYALSVNSNRSAGKIFIHEFGHSFAGLADEYYNSEVAYNEMYPLDVEPWEPNITTLVNFGKKWQDKVADSLPKPTPVENKYLNAIGVYEGGGYAAKGIYRPYIDCLMNTFRTNSFCPICKDAIRKMIEFYIH